MSFSVGFSTHMSVLLKRRAPLFSLCTHCSCIGTGFTWGFFLQTRTTVSGRVSVWCKINFLAIFQSGNRWHEPSHKRSNNSTCISVAQASWPCLGPEGRRQKQTLTEVKCIICIILHGCGVCSTCRGSKIMTTTLVSRVILSALPELKPS